MKKKRIHHYRYLRYIIITLLISLVVLRLRNVDLTRVQAVTGTLNISATSQTASGDITGQKFVDVGSASYFIDPNASGNSLIVAGNVGIGTTSPLAKLDVNGTASVSGALTLYGSPVIASTAKQSLTIGDSNTGNIQLSAGSATPAFVLTTAGQVGIGTTTPGSALEVAGQVKITGGTPGAGKVLTSDGAGLASWTTPSSSYRTLVTLGSDVGSSASNAFQDITGLSFPVASGTFYRFQATIIYTASATTVGSRWAINGPANPTKLAYYVRWATSATAIADINANSYDAGSASNTSFSTTGNVATLNGLIKPSADGTFILRFAPETATADGIVVLAGSTLEYW